MLGRTRKQGGSLCEHKNSPNPAPLRRELFPVGGSLLLKFASAGHDARHDTQVILGARCRRARLGTKPREWTSTSYREAHYSTSNMWLIFKCSSQISSPVWSKLGGSPQGWLLCWVEVYCVLGSRDNLMPKASVSRNCFVCHLRRPALLGLTQTPTTAFPARDPLGSSVLMAFVGARLVNRPQARRASPVHHHLRRLLGQSWQLQVALQHDLLQAQSSECGGFGSKLRSMTRAAVGPQDERGCHSHKVPA